MQPTMQRRALGAIAALALLLTAAGAPAQADTDEENLKAIFQKGQALSKKGQYAAAIEQYEKALALAPKVLGPDHINTALIQTALSEKTYERPMKSS